VIDPETGRRRLVDTSNAKLRTRYRDLAAQRRADIGAKLVSCRADHLTLRTDRDWVLDFVRFVSARRARMLAAGRTRP
jgi:uncharacterized protein (DUF58 family)